MSADNDFNTKYRISGPAHAHYHHEGLEVVPQQLNDTLPEVVPSDAPELNSIQAQSFQKDEYTPATAPSESRRILGFPRRAFLLTVLATVLVVCAVVAGVVGGIFSRLNASTSSQATQQATATATSNLPDPTSSSTWRYIHPNSTITATNYTDSNGRSHRAVFFQDSVGAIIGRFWDDQNKTWESLNMTNALPNRGPVLSGSPLTSSAITLSSQPNRIAVWFLWENLSIDLYQWIGSADDSVLNSAQWEERITLNDAILYAQAGTSMASAWQPPFSRTKTTSIGYWILAYQNDDGNIMAANYSSTKSVIAVESPLCSAGTSIAMDVERSASVTGLAMMTYQYDGEVIRLGGTSETWEHPSKSPLPFTSGFSGLSRMRCCSRQRNKLISLG